MTDIESDPLLRPDDFPYYGTSHSPQNLENESIIKSNVLPETPSISRHIGWGSAYILIISRVIGSGIFAMPGTIIQNAGSPGLALSLWVVGAIFAWASFVVELEYGCMLPQSGGSKVYLEYTYPKPKYLASTLIAVRAVLLGFTASNCIVFAKYVMFATDTTPTDSMTKLIAVGLLTAITLVHSCFYKTGLRIQNTLGWIKIVLVVFMVVTGIFVVMTRPKDLGTRENSLQIQRWTDLWADSDWAWNNVSTALFKIFYSFAGLNNINNVMNEVKNPVSTLKSAGFAALVTACVTYMLVNISYLLVVPLDEIKQSRELIAALFFQRIFGVGLGNTILPIAIALSAAGNVMVVTFSLARVNQEIARQGFLPFSKYLASSKPFNAPMGGLIVHYVPSLLVIIIPPSASVYAFIADVEGYAGQYFALAVAIGLIILRVRQPTLKRPFKAWIPAVWLQMGLYMALILAPLFPPKNRSSDVNFFYATYALVGLLIIIFGVMYWFSWIIVLPYYRGYRLEEEHDIINDGTTITKLIRKRTNQITPLEG